MKATGKQLFMSGKLPECFEHFEAALNVLKGYERHQAVALFGNYLLQTAFLVKARNLLEDAWQELKEADAPDEDKSKHYYCLFKIGFVLGKLYFCQSSYEHAY